MSAGGLVQHGRLRPKQPQLEGRLIRMLHGQPPVIAILHVRVDAESQLFDVKLERFLLIVHIQTNDSNTLTHGTSLSVETKDGPLVLRGGCRRRTARDRCRSSAHALASRTHAGR
jgi:hypothetical protein